MYDRYTKEVINFEIIKHKLPNHEKLYENIKPIHQQKLNLPFGVVDVSWEGMVVGFVAN